ncbi:hypothetical protein IF2G_02112 [Cordyceps javanica]|nr:hypothetical protein IF2G_02112 [Cordyceps javanica]
MIVGRGAMRFGTSVMVQHTVSKLKSRSITRVSIRVYSFHFASVRAKLTMELARRPETFLALPFLKSAQLAD